MEWRYQSIVRRQEDKKDINSPHLRFVVLLFSSDKSSETLPSLRSGNFTPSSLWSDFERGAKGPVPFEGLAPNVERNME